jgi:hypothetical protein
MLPPLAFQVRTIHVLCAHVYEVVQANQFEMLDGLYVFACVPGKMVEKM